MAPPILARLCRAPMTSLLPELEAPDLSDLARPEPVNRKLTLGLSAATYALAVLGFVLLGPWMGSTSPGAGPRRETVAAIDLRAFETWVPLEPPARTESAPLSSASEVPGGGNSLGTGTIDPSLLDPLVIDPVPQVTAPVTLPEILPTRRALPVIGMGLPAAPGGNGISRGAGHGSGTGQGNGIGPGRAGPPVEDLSVLSQPIPTYKLRPGDSPDLTTIPVRIRLTVDAKGIPIEARPLSGPSQLFPEYTRVALLWRFKVPASLHKDAPFRITILFEPVLSKGR